MFWRTYVYLLLFIIRGLLRSKMVEWQKIDFDAIIIGSGPGGATVANELSKSGKRVLILERGHGRPLCLSKIL